jgi:hypothetical protein
MDFQAIADEMKLPSEDTARMRNKRAVKKLINKIGGFKPFRDEDLPDTVETTENQPPVE